jgi:ABC-type microcin C transport system permease subunit YejE
MTVNSNTTDPAARNSPWLGVVKFLFLVILIVIIFLLGQDMVRHRFFQGGWVSQHGVLKP